MYNGYLVFPGGKERPGVDADPSPPSSAVGHERVELYLYSLYGSYGLYRASVPVKGCTFLLPFISQTFYQHPDFRFLSDFYRGEQNNVPKWAFSCHHSFIWNNIFMGCACKVIGRGVCNIFFQHTCHRKVWRIIREVYTECFSLKRSFELGSPRIRSRSTKQ